MSRQDGIFPFFHFLIFFILNEEIGRFEGNPIHKTSHSSLRLITFPWCNGGDNILLPSLFLRGRGKEALRHLLYHGGQMIRLHTF